MDKSRKQEGKQRFKVTALLLVALVFSGIGVFYTNICIGRYMKLLTAANYREGFVTAIYIAHAIQEMTFCHLVTVGCLLAVGITFITALVKKPRLAYL